MGENKLRVFEVGDLVRLKSGGPKMTVKRALIDSLDRSVTYRCQWFAGTKLEGGDFPAESLLPLEGEEG